MLVWEDQYDSLRRELAYRWVDWSQDECSSPWIVRVLQFDDNFQYGCRRHDMMWRTLPAIDNGTGKVWNERNRLAADRTFQADNLAACAEDFSSLVADIIRVKELCDEAAEGYFQGVRLG